jgi:hypothetical protein
MAKPVDKPTELESEEPFITIYEEDFEEASKDPRAKAFIKQAYEKFERMESEGRIIY